MDAPDTASSSPEPPRWRSIEALGRMPLCYRVVFFAVLLSIIPPVLTLCTAYPEGEVWEAGWTSAVRTWILQFRDAGIWQWRSAPLIVLSGLLVIADWLPATYPHIRDRWWPALWACLRRVPPGKLDPDLGPLLCAAVAANATFWVAVGALLVIPWHAVGLRMILASVAEVSLVGLVMLVVPTGLLRDIWESRWKLEAKEASGVPEDKVSLEPFWPSSLWAEILWVLLLLQVVLSVEHGKEALFGPWPVIGVITLSWVYLNTLVSHVISSATCRQESTDREATGVTTGAELEQRLIAAYQRVELGAIRVDVCIWGLLGILAYPYGLVFQGLFLFTALQTIIDVMEDFVKSPRLGPVVNVLFFWRRNRKARDKSRSGKVFGPICVALVVAALHCGLRWLVPSVTLPSTAADLLNAGGGIGQGLIAYLGLMAVLMWRTLQLLEEQRARADKAHKVAEEERRKAEESLDIADQARLLAREEEELALKSAKLAEERLQDATRAQGELVNLNRAIETVLHDLKNDAKLLESLAEDEPDTLNTSAAPAWLELAQGVHMTWVMALGVSYPVTVRPWETGTNTAEEFSCETLAQDICRVLLEGERAEHLGWPDHGGVHPVARALLQELGDRRPPSAASLTDSADVIAWAVRRFVRWEAPARLYRMQDSAVREDIRNKFPLKYVASTIHSLVRELVRNALRAASTAQPTLADLLSVCVGEEDVEGRQWLVVSVVNAGKQGLLEVAQTDSKLNAGRLALRSIADRTGGRSWELEPLPCKADAETAHYVTRLAYPVEVGEDPRNG